MCAWKWWNPFPRFDVTNVINGPWSKLDSRNGLRTWSQISISGLTSGKGRKQLEQRCHLLYTKFLCSIVHSSRAIRDTCTIYVLSYACTMYVHVQCMPIRVRVPGSPVPGPGSSGPQKSGSHRYASGHTHIRYTLRRVIWPILAALHWSLPWP